MSWRLTRGTCSHHQFEALQMGGLVLWLGRLKYPRLSRST